MKPFTLIILSSAMLFLSACQEKSTEDISNLKSVKSTSGKITTEEVSYDIDGKTHQSFVAYSDDGDEVKPVVMVLPEWWGLTDYVKDRATQLAELGYFAMAVDYYGNAETVDTPEKAAALSSELSRIPINARLKFDKAKAQLLKYPNADYNKIAAIGYCFGGSQALDIARQEDEIKGVVSFHGNLMSGIKPKNNDVRILVLHGAADTFVPSEEMAAFKKQMDSAKINYEIVEYPGAMHSFTNPNATEIGKKFNLKVAYDEAADKKSWEKMKTFLQEVFR